ncbi:hypothetical protein D3C71_2024360 [compost metagenome]
MLIYEIADCGCGQQHDSNSDDYRCNHDLEMVSHSDGGNYRVQREYNIKDQDLNDNSDKGMNFTFYASFFLSFQFLMNFMCTFIDQE